MYCHISKNWSTFAAKNDETKIYLRHIGFVIIIFLFGGRQLRIFDAR